MVAPQGAVTGHKGRKDMFMYAVIKTGGKQYRVAKDDIVTIERVAGEAGAKVEFTEVLMVGSGESVKVGTPTVAGAKVTAELVDQTRGLKLIAFKKRRRKNSRRKKGHRQDLSTVRITTITGA
jgi:large subunit ribosomal protein L21